MPFCEISSDFRLHYITNSPQGDASDLDPNKPSILLIPPNVLDVTWLREQFRDPRLSTRYNLIGIDLRHMGESKGPFNPKQDVWVDAADIAVFHEVLQLSPCHMFASGTGSCTIGITFAVLFPEKCLSLFMCTTPFEKGDEPEWIVQSQLDLVANWCFPPDLDAFYETCTTIARFFFNDQTSLEFQNEVMRWWQTHASPKKSTSFLLSVLRGVDRIRLSEQQKQAIRAPTFFLQGNKTFSSTPEYAHALSDSFPNSKFLEIKGGPECCAIAPEYASVVNRVYIQFLCGLSPSLVREALPPDPEGMCKRALARLAEFEGDPAIAQNDPKSTISFSHASPEMVKRTSEMYTRCVQGEKDAINVLNEHGEPILQLIDMYKEGRVNEYFTNIKRSLMAAEADIVKVESYTVLELHPV